MDTSELRRLAAQYDDSDEFGYARQFGAALRQAADEIDRLTLEAEDAEHRVMSWQQLNTLYLVERDEAHAEIDRLRRECREEHELYLIRTEERDEARTQLARAMEVLRWYASAINWREDIDWSTNMRQDRGRRARDVLKELGHAPDD